MVQRGVTFVTGTENITPQKVPRQYPLVLLTKAGVSVNYREV